MFSFFRKLILVIWIFTIISLGYYISLHRELLDPENMLTFFASFGSWAIVVYIIASFIRGIVLLPSMPLVLVGILFFPDNPLLVFGISMVGIVFSGILIYLFSDIMGFDEFFQKYLENSKIEKAIEKYGFYTIFFWSFLPIVMTDLICYVAGIVRYPFWKFVLALTLGESLIVGAIIYGGVEMLSRITL